ncbi:Protein R09B5.11 [Aphelenchoides avenae]|nr:Protein R09B5.11 [Aphelenchus avenae]
MNVVWGAAVSIFPIGALFGGLVAGYLADRLGRRRTLHYTNALAILAAAAMVSCRFLGRSGFYPLFHIGRFLVGFDAGIVLCVAPLYVAELSPVRLRGALASVPQLVCTLSILLAQVVGLPEALGTGDLWSWIFGTLIQVLAK